MWLARVGEIIGLNKEELTIDMQVWDGYQIIEKGQRIQIFNEEGVMLPHCQDGINVKQHFILTSFVSSHLCMPQDPHMARTMHMDENHINNLIQRSERVLTGLFIGKFEFQIWHSLDSSLPNTQHELCLHNEVQIIKARYQWSLPYRKGISLSKLWFGRLPSKLWFGRLTWGS